MISSSPEVRSNRPANASFSVAAGELAHWQRTAAVTRPMRSGRDGVACGTDGVTLPASSPHCWSLSTPRQRDTRGQKQAGDRIAERYAADKFKRMKDEG